MKKVSNNINEIMAEVNLDNICIKNLKEFSERLNENRKKSDQIESLETKTLYKLFLNIGEEVMNSYELAYQKCKEDIVAGKENYEGGFEDIEKKMEQNNELVREIKIEKKNLRKINDRTEKIYAIKQIELKERIIKFNNSGIKLIEDNNQAEIRAIFYMFKDIVESVDALFSSKEYIDNGKVKKNVLNIFSSMASMLPGLGIPIAIKDIYNSIAEILQFRNAKKQMELSFNSVDSEIKKLKDKFINAQVALLLLKFQLEDTDYLINFFT